MAPFAERWRQWREGADDLVGHSLLLRLVCVVAVLLLLLALLFGVLWSDEPEQLDVRAEAERAVAQVADAGAAALPAGYVTTTTLIRISETLLDKPGGFISNDILPPGLLQRRVQPRNRIRDRRCVVGKFCQLIAWHAEVAEQHIRKDFHERIGTGLCFAAVRRETPHIHLVQVSELEQQGCGHRPLVALEVVQVAWAYCQTQRHVGLRQ